MFFFNNPGIKFHTTKITIVMLPIHSFYVSAAIWTCFHYRSLSFESAFLRTSLIYQWIYAHLITKYFIFLESSFKGFRLLSNRQAGLDACFYQEKTNVFFSIREA